jgi:succinate-semialdehyde dehydrogenase/glutarate-semialdehyde dehydrogenase
MTPGETAAAVEEAHAAWKSWRNGAVRRTRAADEEGAAVLRERKEEFARLMALEMGKPLKQGISEAEKCALGCDYYAEHAEAHSRAGDGEDGGVEVLRCLRGRLASFSPSCRGIFRSGRCSGFACAGADGGKHRSAEARVERARLRTRHRRMCLCRLDFRRACFAPFLVGSRQVKAVIEHPLVSAVTLTGSTPAGKAVAAQAGAVLKKTVLELGGSIRTSSSRTPISMTPSTRARRRG